MLEENPKCYLLFIISVEGNIEQVSLSQYYFSITKKADKANMGF
jgi:hypothetical protein